MLFSGQLTEAEVGKDNVPESPPICFDVKFVSAGEGWAVGAEGTVLHTRDGGINWLSERSPTPHRLERIYFTDRNHGWAVGFGGTIIAYGASEQPPKLRR